jgi:hypothetical protein
VDSPRIWASIVIPRSDLAPRACLPAAGNRDGGRRLLVWSMYSCGEPRVSSKGGVAGRPFGLLKFDFLLQIGPSVSDRRACYVLRRRPLITSFLLARHQRRTLAAGPDSTLFLEGLCQS